jgi:gliding motility-associated-like protein
MFPLKLLKLKLLFILLLIGGFSQAETPVVQWARSFGGTNDNIPQSMTTDKFGNVYVAGTFDGGTMTFDSIVLINPDAPNYNMFIVKYDAKGKVLWAKRSDGSYDSSNVTSMATDSNGDIYVSGTFNRSTITFGKFVLHNENAGTFGKMFLVKYNSLGNVLWAKTSINTIGASCINAICTDKYDNIFISGFFRSDSLTLDTKTLLNPGFKSSVFFAKYDSSGNVLFAKSIGSDNVEASCLITVSSKGNIFISGYYYSSSLTFGTIKLFNKINYYIPSSDIFIAKFDESANVIWAKSVGSIGYDNCNSISVDSDENVYLGGYFGDKSDYLGSTLSESFIAFDNIKLQALNTQKNLFVSKYDSSGNAVWAKTNPIGSYGEVCSVYSDKKNLIAIGYTARSLSFGNDTIKSNGSTDAFVAKFNSVGNVLFAKGYGGLGADEGRYITTDKDENIYITGIISNSSINFDSILVNSISGEDMFVAKILASDTLLPKSITFCADDSILTIIAPSNNKLYTWANNYDKVIGNSQTLTIINPVDSAVYTCKFKDSLDSTYIVRYTLLKTIQKADFTSTLSDCKTNTVQFNNQSTTNLGSLNYLWNFGDGTSSIESSPLHKYASGGNHQVGLLINNTVSGCVDSIHKTISYYPKPTINITGDSTICHNVPIILKAQGAATYKWSNGSTADSLKITIPQKVWVLGYSASGCVSDTVFKKITDTTPLVTITGNATFCPGFSTTLKAHGANHYIWSDGSTADSIKVANDTRVWVLGYTTNCMSDTIKFNVSQDPDLNLQLEGNKYYCTGESTMLKISGADSYRWSTGEKTNTISINKAGDYSVTGISKRGCEKTIPIKIVEYKLPAVEFSVTPTTVDTRHNTVKCSIPAQSGVDYKWDMGDGNNEFGAEIQHSYTVSNSLYNYKISLTATNLSGCINTASKTVDILLFIPNVFSPNGDGINDVFMPGVDLEIFDRNGLSLYKGNGGWDGNYHNTKMPNDTYFYVVTYKDNKGQNQTQKGYVILKR